MVEAGLITALGIIWIMCRMNLKRIAGYALFWDVTVSAFLAFIFIGTYAGMVTGLLAGVIVSLFLTTVKKTAGAERMTLVRKQDEALPRIRWKEVS